jgi:hypothetical protein
VRRLALHCDYKPLQWFQGQPLKRFGDRGMAVDPWLKPGVNETFL